MQLVAARALHLNCSTRFVSQFLQPHAERFDNLLLKQNPIDLGVRVKWYFLVAKVTGVFAVRTGEQLKYSLHPQNQSKTNLAK